LLVALIERAERINKIIMILFYILKYYQKEEEALRVPFIIREGTSAGP
jgi:hypothetical protein